MATLRHLATTQTGASRVALVLPGAGYTAQAPLLHRPVRALADAGWDVWGIDWHDDITDDALRDMQGFVESALVMAEELLPARPEVVVAKSLGTFGLPYFAHRDIRAAWLTPILTDPAWRPDLVGETRARLVTVDDADHRLEVTTTQGDTAAQEQPDIIEQIVCHLLDTSGSRD